jgi:ATP-dependent helicase HrpB
LYHIPTGNLLKIACFFSITSVLLSMSYPVLKVLDELQTKLASHSIVILQAPPGAGKSTVIPIELLKCNWIVDQKIVMLEPRRLAARSVASRMSDNLGEDVGSTVGYRVRFDTRVTSKTRIEVVTEGILTRLIQADNSLDGIGFVIFDEFHERSLHADTALALVLQVQQLLRPDLKILIMSATLDTVSLSSLLGNAPVVTSEGRQFPVSFKYIVPEDKDITRSVSRVVRKALQEEKGDILVFLPGAGEITRCYQKLSEESISAEVYTLFGDLPYKKQQEAILPNPQGKRKVILSTSIAETSLTIEGVGVVVDSGLSRVPRFDPRSGFTRLETIRVTRDAADQRAGRAGRLGPGVCYRLWSEGSHMNLVPQRVPEILEADLAPLVLELGEWGVRDVKELTWITLPPSGSVNQAKVLLTDLEALDEGIITSKGKAMLKLPTHPRIAHMILEAKQEGPQSLTLATDIAALMEEKDPMDKTEGADLSLRVDVLRKWRKGERVNADRSTLEKVENLAASWRKLVKVDADNEKIKETDVGRLLFASYPERLAKQLEKFGPRYKLANGRTARLNDNDPLIVNSWLSIAHLDGGLGEGRIFLAAPLSPGDISAHASEREVVKWDDERGMIAATVEEHIGALVLSSRKMTSISPDLKTKALCGVVKEKGIRKSLAWEQGHEEWQNRVLSLRSWRPDDSWPDVSDENLEATVEQWLSPFLLNATKSADLMKIDLYAALSSILSWDQQQMLDRLAPSRIVVPSGSNIRLQYFPDGKAPVIEVRLQEVFGLVETPAVNEGRTPIVLHLLSPGYKPIQVTQDLKSFWGNTYNEVRKELRMRYPRHSWPEDPWTAEAVRGVKKKT